jgi:signal transduction histidine kinase/ligand-binding sensor domain-containing protein
LRTRSTVRFTQRVLRRSKDVPEALLSSGHPHRVAPTLCLIFILLLLIPVAISRGQTDAENASSSPNLHQWGAVTLFHGLPSNHVRAIAQDTDGTLWFGTDSGLAKYDGRRIEKIAVEELASTGIHALELDNKNSLWIGTDNGAYQFVNNQFKALPETIGKTITAIAINKENRIALTSEQGNIFVCTKAQDNSLSVKTFLPSEYPTLNIESNNRPLPLTSIAWFNEAFIVGSHGRGLLKIENNEVNEINSAPRAFFIEALATEANSRLWFGAQIKVNDGGLYSCEDVNRPIKSSENTGTVSALKFDARKNLWAATQGQGVFVFRGSETLEHFTFENTAGGLRSNNVFSIFFDREGVVWFGTDRGVCRYDPQSVRVETISPNAESNFARVLFQSSDGLIWCGTNRGLFVRSAANKFWSEVKDFAGKTIYSIYEDAQRCMLIGTAAGLYASGGSANYFSGSGQFQRIENESQKDAGGDSIRALCEFQGTIHLAAFGRGVERLDSYKRTLTFPVENDEIKKRQVVSLFADKNERLFIGTAGAGVFIYDGRQVTTDKALESLGNKTVWSIAVSLDGAIWFATSKGLFVLANDRLIQVIQDADVRIVIALNEANQAVWCATADNGLHKVLLNETAAPITARFDMEQGLPSQKAFAILSARNESNREVLLIGTNKGLARYEPSVIAPTLKATRVIGSRLFQAQEIQTGLKLEYPQNSLLVDVTAISSRTFPEQFQYNFALQDVTGKLVAQKISRDSQMLMEGLKNGSYTLTARAFTNELIPSDALIIHFTVERAPFPWTTTALAVLLALALMAVWWGYRQNRMIGRSNEALASTNQQLAETRMQLANETETERRRIARDLHDQTLADLRRLMILTDELPASEDTPRGVKPTVFRSEIELVSAEIRRICEDLSPSVLENVGFAAALEYALTDAVAHLPVDKKFEYEFSCEEGIEDKLQLSPVMQIHLYRIAQEVINNISRHSNASLVKLSAKIEESGDFVLEIEDNGRGFDLQRAEKRGRGIANIRSRASLIEAEVSWKSPETGGTRFTLYRMTGCIK